mgnify:CR=1 FL=1
MRCTGSEQTAEGHVNYIFEVLQGGVPQSGEYNLSVQIRPNEIRTDDYFNEYVLMAVDELYASDQWKKVMKSNGLMPFHPDSGEFQAFVKQQINDIQSLSKEIGLIQ